MKRLRAWGNDLMGFLFPLETDRWLTVLRIGLGLQLAVYTLFLKNDWHYLFAGTAKGLVSRELGEAITSLDSPFIPKLGWLVALGGHIGVGEEMVLSVAWAGLLCAGCFLLLGLFCRPAAIIAWFLHLCAAESGGLLAYGADNLMTMGHSYSIQIRSACPRNFNLPARSWLRNFHLDEKDPANLAGWHFGDAYRHRIDNGNVSFRARHDCIESCCVRRRFRSSFPQASSTSPCSFSGATRAVTGRDLRKDNCG